jgi:uncharacterized protein
MEVFTEQDFQVSDWSGGKTIQLYLYPAGSSYSDRNFKFRISIAHVEQEASDFTLLPGFQRKLMVLDGEVQIFHEGHHSKKLLQYETDAFDGAWTTRSIGKCMDFNVMTSSDLHSELFALKLSEGQLELFEIGDNCSLFLFVLNGSVSIEKEGELTHAIKNSLVKLSSVRNEELKIHADQSSELIVTMVRPEIL